MLFFGPLIAPGQDRTYWRQCGIDKHWTRRVSADTERSYIFRRYVFCGEIDSVHQCLPPIARMLLCTANPLIGWIGNPCRPEALACKVKETAFQGAGTKIHSQKQLLSYIEFPSEGCIRVNAIAFTAGSVAGFWQ